VTSRQASSDASRLRAADRARLRRAIELSRLPPPGGGDLPFGAVVALGASVLGEAHNEILALRAAAARMSRPELAGAVVYCSSEPCPMCLAACYWAQIARVVHAAAVKDAAACGFEDSAFYREVALPKPERTLRIDAGDEPLRAEAVDALRRWSRV